MADTDTQTPVVDTPEPIVPSLEPPANIPEPPKVEEPQPPEPIQQQPNGMSAQSVNQASAAIVPKNIAEFNMRGGVENTLANVQNEVQRNQEYRKHKASYEKYIAMGENLATAVETEAKNKYGDKKDKNGNPIYLQYMPHKEDFYDPKTGAFLGHQYAKAWAVGEQHLQADLYKQEVSSAITTLTKQIKPGTTKPELAILAQRMGIPLTDPEYLKLADGLMNNAQEATAKNEQVTRTETERANKAREAHEADVLAQTKVKDLNEKGFHDAEIKYHQTENYLKSNAQSLTNFGVDLHGKKAPVLFKQIDADQFKINDDISKLQDKKTQNTIKITGFEAKLKEDADPALQAQIQADISTAKTENESLDSNIAHGKAISSGYDSLKKQYIDIKTGKTTQAPQQTDVGKEKTLSSGRKVRIITQ
jgi:hypothetical protein